MLRNLTRLGRGRNLRKAPSPADPQVRVVAAENVTRADYAELLVSIEGLLREHGLFAFGVREEASREDRAKGKKGRWLGVVVSVAAPSTDVVTGLSRILDVGHPTVIVTNDGEWRVRISSFDLILDIFSLPWIPELSNVLGNFPNSEVATGHLEEAHFYAVVAKSGLERLLDLSPKVWWPYALKVASGRQFPRFDGVGASLRVEDLFRGKNLYRTAELEAVLVESFQEYGRAHLTGPGRLKDVATNSEERKLTLKFFAMFEGEGLDVMRRLWDEVLEDGSSEEFEDELLECLRGFVTTKLDVRKKTADVASPIHWDIELELSETPGINLVVDFPWPPTVTEIDRGKLLGSNHDDCEVENWLREADERSIWATWRLWQVLNLLSLSSHEVDGRLDSMLEFSKGIISADIEIRMVEKISLVSQKHGFLTGMIHKNKKNRN